MTINKISIHNFKNIEEANLTFSPKMNCFFGNNGMGKTNIMDALYYLSFTKNHTSLPDSQIIKHGAEYCLLQGHYTGNSSEEEISCSIKPRSRKIFRRNKKEYQRMSEHIGIIPLVMISPADSALIQGGSDERRKFIDIVISQYDKEYLHTLINYNRTLQQRNTLLRESAATTADNTLFDILDHQLAAGSTAIHAKRLEFTKTFIPVFKEYHKQISHHNENIEIHYESQLNNNPNIETQITGSRERDRQLGYTSAGIHKDDLQFLIDTYLIRKIGSEGQNKTCLIAMKLAQFDYLAKKGANTPLLLLDDIFDKLDARRVEQIIKLAANLKSGQIFITDTNRKYLDEILAGMTHDYKLFHVENGKISEQ
jgi:DNA replication and repair protein RecF